MGAGGEGGGTGCESGGEMRGEVGEDEGGAVGMGCVAFGMGPQAL